MVYIVKKQRTLNKIKKIRKLKVISFSNQHSLTGHTEIGVVTPELKQIILQNKQF